MSDSEFDHLLSRREMAEKLGISPGKVDWRFMSGKLPPPLQVGHQSRWRWFSVVKLLEGQPYTGHYEPEQDLKLLGPVELAERLGVSASSVRRLARIDKLPPPLMVGGQLRWRWSLVLKFLEDHRKWR